MLKKNSKNKQKMIEGWNGSSPEYSKGFGNSVLVL